MAESVINRLKQAIGLPEKSHLRKASTHSAFSDAFSSGLLPALGSNQSTKNLMLRKYVIHPYNRRYRYFAVPPCEKMLRLKFNASFWFSYGCLLFLAHAIKFSFLYVPEQVKILIVVVIVVRYLLLAPTESQED